ncbi:hypothetical protein [Novosphingobium sp. Chol11]|uniref:hypothetical protein n=1 Tax=Novosphingobium sp. Chol11 TaxID=1385763 RepID=UPI0025F01CB7|nr:hypothetical protein [Novosphingobium sp. Chol11]
MSVSGTYACVIKSPLGEQKMTLTVNADGDTFTGSSAGDQGNSAITDGKVDGNSITWSSEITVPMPMKLDCAATIDGDTVTGSVTAGMFGTFPLNGTRTA